MEAGYTLEIAIPPHFTEGMLVLKRPVNDNIAIDGTEAMEREVQFQVFTNDRKYQARKERRADCHQWQSALW